MEPRQDDPLKQIRAAPWSPHEIMHGLVEHKAENNDMLSHAELSMITLTPLIFILDSNITMDPFHSGWLLTRGCCPLDTVVSDGYKGAGAN